MKIAFLHYHLKPGGVTTVIKHQAMAIEKTCSSLVLTGSQPEFPFPTDTADIAGIGYDRQSGPKHDPLAVADKIVQTIHSKWKDGCDILHVHNPTLAKNRNFLHILKALQKQNIRLLLQIHDFAEDGRPMYYFDEDYVADCHYAVLNSRDYNILATCGLTAEGLHKIPNPIIPFRIQSETPPVKNRVLYPVRAIRRKNIGEAILISLFFKNKPGLAISLPPNSPADIKRHGEWKDFVRTNHLNVAFDAGLTKDFRTLVASAKFVLTTSISEGFGFSFLEPWLADKVLWGRKLADICADFEKKGVNLKHLYETLQVPLEWIDQRRFFSIWKRNIENACTRLNCIFDEAMIENAYRSLTGNHTIDFGLLDESFQKQVIAHVITDNAERKTLVRLNSFLSSAGEIENGPNLTKNNAKAIVNGYSMEIYKEKLLKTYGQVIQKPVRQQIDKNRLASAFLDLNRFSLLKWGITEEGLKGEKAYEGIKR